jgi:hypothetical protein
MTTKQIPRDFPAERDPKTISIPDKFNLKGIRLKITFLALGRMGGARRSAI